MVDVKALPFFTNCKEGVGGEGGGGGGDTTAVSLFKAQHGVQYPTLTDREQHLPRGFLIWPLGRGGVGASWLSSCLSAWRRELRLSLRECELHAPGIQMERDDDVIWVERNSCFGAMSQCLVVRVMLICSKTLRQSVWWLCLFPCESLMRSNIYNEEETSADSVEPNIITKTHTHTHARHYLLNTAQCWQQYSKYIFQGQSELPFGENGPFVRSQRALVHQKLVVPFLFFATFQIWERLDKENLVLTGSENPVFQHEAVES